MWSMESQWWKCYPIQLCGSWRVTDESITPFKYVVHGELMPKVLHHSNMWFMESYWRKYYPIQICGSWRVTEESITPFKYVVYGESVMKVLPHSNMWFMESYWREYYPIQGNTFFSNSPWTTYLNGVILSSVTLHEPHIWMVYYFRQ
jgi:hypothetical protein